MTVGESVIVAIGNALLDITASGSKELLDRPVMFIAAMYTVLYGLNANNSIMAEEEHLPLFEELSNNNCPVVYSPGGGSQNTIRMAQWILAEPKSCVFFGCIGRDKFGQIIQQQMEELGVHANYLLEEDHPTGTCASIVTGNERSLVANLAAANCYKKDHLMKAENWNHVEKSKLIYVAGFHLTVAPDAIVALGRHAAEKNKIFSFNLSAPYLCEDCMDQILSVMPFVDYLFGNETDFASFGKEQNMGTEDLKEIALKAAVLRKENTKRQRTVIITRGHLPTLVAYDGVVTEYPVKAVNEEDIVDTNGAGDCFVGGFLSQLVQGKDIKDCILIANYCASYIIQKSGVTFDEKPNLPK
ncbi:uncharacterized protein [Apostichopus japonicus]|uniref:uncharacterized protein isoform X1 n=1 Tax=Stichopus japonicus TaxID=307972 RepID=UPI003AB1CB5A